MSFVAPNWKNKTDYPDPKNQTNLLFWAWEFLRRNKKYQKEWREYVFRLRTIVVQYPELNKHVNLLISGLENVIPADKELLAKALKNPNYPDYNEINPDVLGRFEFPAFNPPALFGETSRERQRRWESMISRADMRTLNEASNLFSSHWGLRYIVNPALSYSSVYVRWLNNGKEITRLTSDTKINYNDFDYFIHPFDLRFPLDVLKAQFQRILLYREMAITGQDITPYTGRPEKSRPNFTNYLRVIDALDASIAIAEIAAEMSPSKDKEGAKKTVENWKKKGMLIRDVEYKSFPAYETF